MVLGVGGGIAAYKACEVVRGLAEAGHSVRVVPTAAALNFVGAATWAALSGNPVAETIWMLACGALEKLGSVGTVTTSRNVVSLPVLPALSVTVSVMP